jgi:hypothetical protein
MEVGMTFAEVLKYFRVGDRILYRNANGKLTNGGSFVVLGIKPREMIIEIPNGKRRPLRESDWNEVEQNLTALQKSRSVCQSMKTQNTTYILSLRWFPGIAVGHS